MLRNEPDVFWSRTRDLLAERGVDPQRSVLVASFPEDVNVEYGLAVRDDGRVFEFEFTYADEESIGEGTFTLWAEVTASWRDHHCAAEVEEGLALLGRAP